MFVPTSDAALVDRRAKDMAAAPPQVGMDAGEQLGSHDAELQAGLQAAGDAGLSTTGRADGWALEPMFYQ